MYKDGELYQDSNGYILVFIPDHPRAIQSGSFQGYVYEHILVAEQDVLDRPLKPGEVVHHLDKNKANNSPDNILVLTGPMHVKLHAWLDRHLIIPNEEQQIRNSKGCVRCKVCNTPIPGNQVYCSTEHYHQDLNSNSKKPSKEKLDKLVWEKPTSTVAKELGVSDAAVGKWCKEYGLTKPARGYWSSKKSEVV